MAVGAFLECVFPPFPGDLWAAGGAMIAAQGGTSGLVAVFLGVNAGSVLGSLLGYSLGRWLAAPARRLWLEGPRGRRVAATLQRIDAGFSRHPRLYLLANRFLPGIRALFFVAAGHARIRLGLVVGYGLVSAVVWNALLIAGGYAVGMNVDRLMAWVSRYTWGVWTLLGIAGLVAGVIWWRRRRGRNSAGGPRPYKCDP